MKSFEESRLKGSLQCPRRRSDACPDVVLKHGVTSPQGLAQRGVLYFVIQKVAKQQYQRVSYQQALVRWADVSLSRKRCGFDSRMFNKLKSGTP